MVVGHSLFYYALLVIMIYATIGNCVFYYCTFIDINECNSYHECEQICQNLPGTFECACEEGYFLQVDGKQCAGSRIMSMHS